MIKNSNLEYKYEKLINDMNIMIDNYELDGKNEEAMIIRKELEILKDLKYNDSRLQ